MNEPVNDRLMLGFRFDACFASAAQQNCLEKKTRCSLPFLSTVPPLFLFRGTAECSPPLFAHCTVGVGETDGPRPPIDDARLRKPLT